MFIVIMRLLASLFGYFPHWLFIISKRSLHVLYYIKNKTCVFASGTTSLVFAEDP